MLDHLRRIEATQPLARPQLVGRILFDMVGKMIANDRGVRMEDLLAILASCGGFSCLSAAFSEVLGPTPPTGNNLTVVEGKDGHRYFFGDLPNRYLIESEFALLGLALGMAQACGGTVSLDMAHQTMRRVANTVGGDEFGKPELPTEHRPGDFPINYVRDHWPKALEALNFYEVPPTLRPAAIGFALQRAIEAGQDAIDPTMAARIVIECAVPMAKIDPERLV
ncbi:hypothetical protein FG93_01122 [Bosea sp. LC85]|nr:hypothetical protein FG93_01122 [Bosea sp. LC85]